MIWRVVFRVVTEKLIYCWALCPHCAHTVHPLSMNIDDSRVHEIAHMWPVGGGIGSQVCVFMPFNYPVPINAYLCRAVLTLLARSTYGIDRDKEHDGQSIIATFSSARSMSAESEWPSMEFQPAVEYPSGEREDVLVPGQRVFAVPMLAAAECEALIAAASILGFRDVASEYVPEYRNCDRVVARCPALATTLWERLRGHWVREDVHGVRPYGPGNEGTWRPVAVNPCMRVSRYGPGHHFSPHRDGSFVVTDNLRSVYTLQVYLNDASEFEGIAPNLQDPLWPLSPQCWTFGCLSPLLCHVHTCLAALVLGSVLFARLLVLLLLLAQSVGGGSSSVTHLRGLNWLKQSRFFSVPLSHCIPIVSCSLSFPSFPFLSLLYPVTSVHSERARTGN